MKSICWLLVCSIFMPAPAWGQEPRKGVVLPDGYQAFCNIILHHEFALQPIKTLEELADTNPEETLLIVLGETDVLDDIRRQIGSLEKFRSKGGAILIASDRNDQGRLHEWNLHITGGVVTEDASLAYKGLKDCPKITRPAKAHMILQNTNQGLATNTPSVIQFGQSDFDLLARYSLWSRLDGVPFLGAFLVARERALVMASQTVFWNVLMAQTDIDNFLFAKNCVRWLAESKQGKRKYALFVEGGHIVSQFDVGLTVPAPLPFPPVMVLNQLLRGLEDESFFHNILDRLLRRDQILRTLLLLVTLVLLLYGCKRLVGGRHRIESAVPLLTPLPAAVLTVHASRQQALLKGGDFREPCRDLARFFFEERAQLPASHHGVKGISPPAISAGGSWLERRWLARQLPYLWQLAYGDPGRVSRRQFARLPRILDRLTAVIRAGRLHWIVN